MQERRNNKRFGPIPVKEGDTYEVEIEGIGEKGDGIARVNGYVIIVPNVQKGDNVKVKVNAVRGKVSFGEVLEKTEKASGKAKKKGKEEPAEESEEDSMDESNDDAEDDTDDEDFDDEEEKEE